MLSFWEKDLFDHHFDCIVIGAGFTGINMALAFKQKFSAASVLVVDDGAGFKGASTKNAGFACYGSPSELISDMALMGEEAALELLGRRRKGIEAIERFCHGTGIYVKSRAYEVFLERNSELYEKSRTSVKQLNRLVKDATGMESVYLLKSTNQVSKAIGTIEVQGEGQVQPAALRSKLYKEALNLGIRFCDARAMAIENRDFSGAAVRLANGLELKSKWLVNCVNGFNNSLTNNTLVAPARAQVLITSEIENLPYSGNYHMDEGYFYFRNVGRRLLLGGGRNLAFKEETTDRIALNPLIQSALKSMLKSELLPGYEFKVTDQWAGIMGMRSDKSPGIEREGNCLSIVGLSGMGVALSFYLPQLALKQME